MAVTIVLFLIVLKKPHTSLVKCIYSLCLNYIIKNYIGNIQYYKSISE